MTRIGMVAGLAAAALLAACSDNRGAEPLAEGAAPREAAPEVEAVVFENNDRRGERSREFSYNWPGEVSAVPALVERFSAERDAALAEQKQDFEDALREYEGSDCLACTNRSYAKEWKVVADLPRFLSLSAVLSVYSGGAHGNSGSSALVWDREAERALDAVDLFRSPDALQGALYEPWCAALKTEREKRLGGDFTDDGFFNCPPISDLAVLLGSSNGQTFDRIGLIADPYVAGSYAEGFYEITLRVNERVLAAVRPEYAAAFSRAK